MPAHAQIAHVLEINTCRLARWIKRLQQNPAHDNVRAARLSHNSRSKKVVSFAKACKPLCQRTATKLGASCNHNAGWFACSMGIDDLDRSGSRHEEIIVYNYALSFKTRCPYPSNMAA